MERIISINEATFRISGKEYNEFDGYQIVTDHQTIQFGIDNGQSCCESWGSMITNDEAAEFIGANLIGISITDQALNNKKIEDLEHLDCGGVMFVNFETDKGLLQFAAYNSHNGYYGHEAVVVSKQLNHSEIL
jgi:hypothetical protein